MVCNRSAIVESYRINRITLLNHLKKVVCYFCTKLLEQHKKLRFLQNLQVVVAELLV